MEIIRRRFEISGRSDSIDIDLYGDTHFGSKSVDESLLKRHIKETETEGRYWAFLGDGIDAITPDDRKRWNTENVADWAWMAYKNKRLVQAEYERFAECFAPIASKCLFYLAGDGKHNRHENIADCRSDMCAALKIPGPYQTAYYIANIKRCATSNDTADVPIIFHHGTCGASTDGAKINYLNTKLRSFPEAWAFFCAHGHTKVTTPPQVGLVARGSKVQAIYRRAAMTGSYLKTYAQDTIGYAEVKMYAPVALGRITVRLSPFHAEDQKRLVVFNN